MKVKKITKNLFLSMFIIVIICISEIPCANPGETNINISTNSLSPEDSLGGAVNSKPLIVNSQEKKLRPSSNQKKLQKFKLKSANEEKNVETESEDEEVTYSSSNNLNNNQNKQSNSILYVSWFIFVPLVLLIFIMTILSIAGFLILILSSTGTHNHPHPTPNATIHTNNPQLRENLNRLSNEEILQIIRYKQQIKKKTKKAMKSNYKPEPEPEGVILKQ